ncbi:MAG TPA: type II toxin-antitoxin system RelE/ParE family toxin [Candidatus Olsenella avicola]|nr:type II toxin-antitoxin system RelE/ParE family toxin [Candidatus Olsenella avicola]
MGRTIVLTNGFVKTTRRTPQREIQKALRYREDYLRRRYASE